MSRAETELFILKKCKNHFYIVCTETYGLSPVLSEFMYHGSLHMIDFCVLTEDAFFHFTFAYCMHEIFNQETLQK